MRDFKQRSRHRFPCDAERAKDLEQIPQMLPEQLQSPPRDGRVGMG